MWLFQKKVSHDDFRKFKTNVKKSFQRNKKDVKLLNQRYEFLRKELNKVKPLSIRFSELQRQSYALASLTCLTI
jgi:uncharacterized protein involved in exopolysaccharide biosynthesis